MGKGTTVDLDPDEILLDVPKWRRILFGVGYLGIGIEQAIMLFFQSLFLLEVAEIPPVWVGNIMIIKQFWDGLIDPIIGTVTDNVPTRFGRRKPWIFSFLIPTCLAWIAMWASPGWLFDNETARIFYYGAIIFIFSSFDSFVVVPYQSMIPDMSTGYHGRTFTVLFTQIFLLLGTGSASFIWSFLVEYFPVMGDEEHDAGMEHDYRRGYLIASIVVVVPIFCAYFVSAIAAKEREFDPSEKSESGKRMLFFLTSIKDVVLFPPFIAVMGFSIVNLVATALFTNNLILWIKYVYEDEPITSYCLLVLQVTMILFLVFWAVISRVIGKIPTYFLGGFILIIGFVLIYKIDYTVDTWILLCSLIEVGMGTSAGYLIINSLVPDVIALDEQLTGKRREAIYYSLYSFIGKVSTGIAQLVLNYSLGVAGYLNPKQQAAQGVSGQPDDVLTLLTWLVSLIPLMLRILGFALALVYYFVHKRYAKKALVVKDAFAEDENLVSSQSH